MLSLIAICNAVVFAGGKTPDVNARGYTQIMKEQLLRGEENEVSIVFIFIVSVGIVVCFVVA